MRRASNILIARQLDTSKNRSFSLVMSVSGVEPA
jgi:hypothetical protein